MTFNYFYGTEADQFSFYRIPKALFTDSYFKDLSSDAKILYGLMLDRMSLSIKNQWFDDKNRAYIYFSIEDIMELLNCGRNKAIKSMRELDDEEDMKMSENNDYIQLPPLKKDTPSDVVAFMWEYMKVPENSREKVKNLLKDANENGVKLSHQAPTLYDVVPKEEIAEFEELMRKTIADIVSESSSVACWVYVQKYVKQKTLDEMLQELPGAGQFIIVMDTWFERLMAE